MLVIDRNKLVSVFIISNKVLTALHQPFTKMFSKQMKYAAKFKLQLVKFAQELNNYAASREYGVNEKLVCDWQKQVEKLKCMPNNKCSNREKRCQWPELEDKLVNWIEDQRQFGYILTRNMIRIKALAMIDKLNITGFQASSNFYVATISFSSSPEDKDCSEAAGSMASQA